MEVVQHEKLDKESISKLHQFGWQREIPINIPYLPYQLHNNMPDTKINELRSFKCFTFYRSKIYTITDSIPVVSSKESKRPGQYNRRCPRALGF